MSRADKGLSNPAEIPANVYNLGRVDGVDGAGLGRCCRTQNRWRKSLLDQCQFVLSSHNKQSCFKANHAAVPQAFGAQF